MQPRFLVRKIHANVGKGEAGKADEELRSFTVGDENAYASSKRRGGLCRQMLFMFGRLSTEVLAKSLRENDMFEARLKELQK